MELSVKILFAVLITIIVIILGFVIDIWNKQKKNNSCTSESYDNVDGSNNTSLFVLPTIIKNEKEWVFSIDSNINQMGSRNLYRIEGLKPHMLCEIIVGNVYHGKLLNFISNEKGVVIFSDSYFPVSSIHQKLLFRIWNPKDVKGIVGVYGPVSNNKMPVQCKLMFDVYNAETFEKYKKCVTVIDNTLRMDDSGCDDSLKRCLP
jgi:hypothetical protein